MLRADYSIDCDAAGHAKYRYLAAAMAVVFPVGSLALYSVVLWRHRRLLHPPPVHGRPKEDKPIAEEAKRINAVVLRPLALLHDACEWLAVFGGVFLVLFDVSCLPVPTDRAVVSSCRFRVSCACQMLRVSLDRFGEIFNIAVLTPNSSACFASTPSVHFSDEPSIWWYEIFETCRRITLSSLVYLATKTSMQLWIAMGATMVRGCLLVAAVTQAFDDRSGTRDSIACASTRAHHVHL